MSRYSSLCRDSKETTSQPLFFAKVQAQKEAREAAQKGKSRRCPTGGISHGNISMAVLADRRPPNAASRRKVTSEVENPRG